MGALSALLALCEGYRLVNGGFLSQWGQQWGTFMHRLFSAWNNPLNKQSSRRLFENPISSIDCNVECYICDWCIRSMFAYHKISWKIYTYNCYFPFLCLKNPDKIQPNIHGWLWCFTTHKSIVSSSKSWRNLSRPVDNTYQEQFHVAII